MAALRHGRLEPRFATIGLRGLVALLSTVAIFAGILSCGGDSGDAGSPEVLIQTDAGPRGSTALVKDTASGSQHQRVPVTASGDATVVYAVRLDDLEEGMRVGALATVTLTKCAITDYIPNARSFTACEGTKRYTYDPVTIESGFRLVGGSAKPDLSSPGSQVGGSLKTRCTTAIHHCTISQDGGLELSAADAAGANWLVFEVTARSPKAAPCRPPMASACDVLAVETQKGTAMYGVRVKGNPPSVDSIPPDTKPADDKLDVLINRGDKNGVRKVVYSVPLSSAADIDSLRGDQMEISSLLKIDEKLPQAPDIANYVVLSDSPTNIRGRYLLSDSYDPGKTGNNGENCNRSCEFTRPAVVTAVLQCDIDAGRRFVNFVADASRAAARPGESVTVADGGYLKVSEYYDAAITSDRQSVGDCDR